MSIWKLVVSPLKPPKWGGVMYSLSFWKVNFGRFTPNLPSLSAYIQAQPEKFALRVYLCSFKDTKHMGWQILMLP